jgi:tRNA modification GTPase
MDIDTIAAISTPLGEGGISVIRVSGDQSILRIETIFNSKSILSQVDSHTVHYGHIIDPLSKQVIDEVLITVMHAPRTFTTENTVEISCHGGIVITYQVLKVILDLGIRLAEPGEFTKRAFLHGRIDLAKAEAVIDLIKSKSSLASKIALKQIKGELSNQINEIRHELIKLMAHIEVNIDYPEHDVQEMTQDVIHQSTTHCLNKINMLIKYANQGKIIREGISTAIIGKPNVGKSSLLNSLSQENKSIVTDIPGTTRDVVEQYITLNQIPLKLLDTAGIRETTDVVEMIGVERSRAAMEDASLVLFMLNHNIPLDRDDIMMMNELVNRPAIFIINKIDQPRNLDVDFIRSKYPEKLIIEISLTQHKGVDELEHAIKAIFFDGDLETDDLTYVSNARHIDLLKKSKQSLLDASEANSNGIPIDIIQLDIRASWEFLGEIIGDTVSETLIDQIFAQFCLGK